MQALAPGALRRLPSEISVGLEPVFRASLVGPPGCVVRRSVGLKATPLVPVAGCQRRSLPCFVVVDNSGGSRIGTPGSGELGLYSLD